MKKCSLLHVVRTMCGSFGMAAEDELATFFLYSFLIYPLIHYVISPERKYARWKGIGLAIIIFTILTLCQLAYDAHISGPNYYQRLHLNRDATLPMIKKSFKKLSLELHPDKNRSPDAVDKYLSVKTAYDILIDTEKRDIYNRLGERGLELAAHNPIRLDFLLIRTTISTATNLFFTFLLTLSDPSGHSMTISLLSIAGAVLLLLSSDLLIVVFVLELKFILLGSPLPAFLFPSLTPHDLLLIAQAMKPAIMHCSKAIFSSLYVNPLDILSQNAISVTATQKVLNGKFVKLLKQIQNVSKKDRTMVSVKETTRETSSAQEEKTDGSISCILRTLHHRVQKEDPKDVNRGVERVALMMKKSEEPATSPPAPFPLYYLAIYVLSRWLFYQRRS